MEKKCEGYYFDYIYYHGTTLVPRSCQKEKDHEGEHGPENEGIGSN